MPFEAKRIGVLINSLLGKASYRVQSIEATPAPNQRYPDFSETGLSIYQQIAPYTMNSLSAFSACAVNLRLADGFPLPGLTFTLP